MSESFTPADWHSRFVQQARWTQELRHYLYGRADLKNAHHVLDVGCGTGVLATELEKLCQADVLGLDIAHNFLELAMRKTGRAKLVQGDAHHLPFSTQTYDLAACHFVLLWVTDPFQVIQEMKRVVRPGGAVLALAEPDYGGRIDYPQELAILGDLQRVSLRQQGADPLMGRKLANIFHKAGLVSVETGVLGGQWATAPSKEDWELEWRTLEHDLKQTSGPVMSPEALKALDWEAYQNGERILFVPTFYAMGVVPG